MWVLLIVIATLASTSSFEMAELAAVLEPGYRGTGHAKNKSGGHGFTFTRST